MQYEYSYNIEGILESKSASGKTLINYSYDKNNNIKIIKDITGKSSIYNYDNANRVTIVEDNEGNNLAKYQYYKNNKVKAVTLGNGLKTDYSYDGDGNIQSLVTISKTGEVLVDYNYAYDLNGNRIEKVSTNNKNFYNYDSMNRLKEATYNGRTESFTYDKVGNRLTKTTNNITEKYSYNIKNQLKEIQSENKVNSFIYDKQGNLIKEETAEGNNLFEYNPLNQQIKGITKEGNTLVSRYDAEGLRTEIEGNEKLTKFIFHNNNILVERDKEDSPISRFTIGYDIISADVNKDEEVNRYYYTADEQGSTIFITDKDSFIKNSYNYDAFGNTLESKEEVHNRIKYSGQQFDTITGQYYLRARFYNPVIGRFTQEDIYRGDGLNLYAYCKNNPVGYYDPSGYSGIQCESKSNPYDILKKNGIPSTLDDIDREILDSGNWRMQYDGGADTEVIKKLLPRGDKLPYTIDIKQNQIALDTYIKLRETGLNITELDMISRNTGLDIDTVIKLKEHIFLTEHVNLLNNETRTYFTDYFQPDMDIAYGWEQALKGSLNDSEKAWFRQLADHELFESSLMKQGEPYRTIESIDINGEITTNPPGAHDKAPKPPGDFPGFNPKI